MKQAALFSVLPAFVSVLLSGCAGKPPVPPERLSLSSVAFHDLSGWKQDRHAEAVSALLNSCPRMTEKPGWKPLCAALDKNRPATDEDARRFFETWFTPYAVRHEAPGLFTGYYEAELNGARQQGGVYQTPLWGRPHDLVTADLGAFRPELSGQRIAGKIEGHKLQPYDDRAAIASGSLAGRARPLLWTDDPVNAFFLEIQGAGRARLADGSILRIGYEAQNGKTYVPIGRVLAETGEIEKPVTMAKIRAWLCAHPSYAQAMMNRNPSVVFFRSVDGDGPVGAQGVVLTPERSLAVDPAFVSLGTPLWLELEKDDSGVTPPARLVVAQDAGGAIKGPVRGDLFWGAGPEAEAHAGAMQSRGAYYLFLPKTVTPDARE
jgi:membrane-bound lytic murein transglycosylase A